MLITSVFDLEDDVKMELGYIGDYVELRSPRSLQIEDDTRHRAWEQRAPWESKGSMNIYSSDPPTRWI